MKVHFSCSSAGRGARRTDSTERRHKRPVHDTTSLLISPPSANHHVGLVVESGKKMALNQRTANQRLWLGNHVHAHVCLRTSPTGRSGLCSHQSVQQDREEERKRKEAIHFSPYKLGGPRFSMSGSQRLLPWRLRNVSWKEAWDGATVVSDADAPKCGGPGSQQRAHKSPTMMGCSVSLYYLLVLFTSSASALN